MITREEVNERLRGKLGLDAIADAVMAMLSEERESAYYEPKRSRYFAKGSYVKQEIPGNVVVICETVHGQPQAEMIADALNAWQTRHK